MLKGGIIAESLKVGALIEHVPLSIRKLWRLAPTELATDQPRIWTLIEFEAPDEHAQKLAELVSGALDDSPPWYCDFHSDSETYVVLPGKVFRYERGDVAARARVEAYIKDIYPAIPDAQLDWPD